MAVITTRKSLPRQGARVADADRRRQPRVAVEPMYTSVVVRVLSAQEPPLEGHVINLSESGLAIDLDKQLQPGQAVTVEFCISGLGVLHGKQWPCYAAAAEVLRHDDVDDFPGGPYRTALRFIRVPSIVRAQIARYIVAHPAACNRRG